MSQDKFGVARIMLCNEMHRIHNGFYCTGLVFVPCYPSSEYWFQHIFYNVRNIDLYSINKIEGG